jgi:hypothetical protein
MGAQLSQVDDEKKEAVFLDSMGVLPNGEVKLREGSKVDPMRSPFASGQSQYPLIMQQEDWKRHLYANMDDEYLIKSILSTNAVEEEVLLDGIAYVQQPDEEAAKNTVKDIKSLEDSIAAGIDIDVSEIATVCEKSLKLGAENGNSPYLLSFQRRLSLLMSMRGFISSEQKDATEPYKPRIYSKRAQELTSTSYPELSLMHSLKDTGINCLKMFAASHKLLELAGGGQTEPGLVSIDNAVSDEYRKALASLEDLVKSLCLDVCKMRNLELLPCWAPAQEPLKMAVGLNAASVIASTGNASLAIDGKSGTCWSTTNLRSSWSVKFKKPTMISSIEVAWDPGLSQLTAGMSAPKRVVIAVMLLEPDGSIVFKDVLTVSPAQEFRKQGGTWTQTYSLVDVEDIKKRKVAGVMLNCKRKVTYPTDDGESPVIVDSVKIYSFACFTPCTDDNKWMNTLDTLQALQEHMLPLLAFKEVTSFAAKALKALIRSSGSLRLVLFMLRRVHRLPVESRSQALEALSAGDDDDEDNGSGNGDGKSNIKRGGESAVEDYEYDELRSAIVAEKQKIQMRIRMSGLESVLNKHRFVMSAAIAEKKKCELTEDNLRVDGGPGSNYNNGAPLFCSFVDVEVTTGLLFWEVTLLHATPVLDTTSVLLGMAPFGLASEMTGADIETSSEVFMVQCSNGKLFSGGGVPAGGVVDRRVKMIKQDDVCRFCYDANKLTLSLIINGVSQGVIFEGVPPGLRPIVVLKGDRKSVRLVEVLKSTDRGEGAVAVGNESSSLAKMVPGSKSGESLSFDPYSLLHEIADLSVTRRMELEDDDMICSAGSSRTFSVSHVQPSTLLEYPYCVDVDDEVISALVDLLEDFGATLVDFPQSADIVDNETDTERATERVLSVLAVLDLQFYSLNKSQVQPTHVGLDLYSDDDEKVLSPLILRASATVKALFASDGMKKRHPQVSREAERVFARGSSVFLPTLMDKVRFASAFMDGMKASGEESWSESILLGILVASLSSMPSVLSMIQALKTECDDDRAILLTFIKHLLEYASLGQSKGKLAAAALTAAAANGKKDGVEAVQPQDGDMQRSAWLLLSRLQESMLYDLISRGEAKQQQAASDAEQQDSTELLHDENISRGFVEYVDTLCSTATSALTELSRRTELTSAQADKFVRDSVVGTLLQPLLPALCFVSANLDLTRSLLPPVLKLLSFLAHSCRISHLCRDANASLFTMIQKKSLVPKLAMNSTPDDGGGNDSGRSGGGWQPVKCFFEESEGGYETDDGDRTLYVSVSSTNTCAVANTCFSGEDMAAWEFELLQDNNYDECSVFGAARRPLLSRCYSSSVDLWMRRSYNGYMYCQGRSITPSQGRIHQGDIVRCEFDAKAGTLSFSVNGAEPEVGFTGITDPIYPAVGSYRSGVRVRMLKVEIYRTPEQCDRGQSVVGSMDWLLKESEGKRREKGVLGITSPSSSSSPPDTDTTTVTARGDAGVHSGVHDWTFEVLEKSMSVVAFGVVQGSEVPASDALLGTKDHAAATTKAKADEKEKNGEYTKSTSVACAQLAWHSNGELWVDGERMVEGWGLSHLPLPRLCAVSMRLDMNAKTLSFSVDGDNLGVAFGPPGSGAACEVSVSLLSCESFEERGEHERDEVIYPAASVTASTQQLKLRASGFYGTVVIPLQAHLHKTAASTFGRMAATVLRGDPVDAEEKELFSWLKSPLFIGGLDDDAAASHAHPLWADEWARLMDTGVPAALSGLSAAASASQTSSSESVMTGTADSDDETATNTSASNGASIAAANPTVMKKDFFAEFVAGKWLKNKPVTAKGGASCYEPRVLSLFFSWLESINAEHPNLVKVLQKNGSYRFPQCELPYITALTKHSGLVDECLSVAHAVEEAVSKLESDNSDNVAMPVYTDIADDMPKPSADMRSMWLRVQKLRLTLRQQRQYFKSRVSPDDDQPMMTSSFWGGDSPMSRSRASSRASAGQLTPTIGRSRASSRANPNQLSANSISADGDNMNAIDRLRFDAEADEYFYGSFPQIQWGGDASDGHLITGCACYGEPDSDMESDIDSDLDEDEDWYYDHFNLRCDVFAIGLDVQEMSVFVAFTGVDNVRNIADRRTVPDPDPRLICGSVIYRASEVRTLPQPFSEIGRGAQYVGIARFDLVHASMIQLAASTESGTTETSVLLKFQYTGGTGSGASTKAKLAAWPASQLRALWASMDSAARDSFWSDDLSPVSSSSPRAGDSMGRNTSPNPTSLTEDDDPDGTGAGKAVSTEPESFDALLLVLQERIQLLLSLAPATASKQRGDAAVEDLLLPPEGIQRGMSGGMMNLLERYGPGDPANAQYGMSTPHLRRLRSHDGQERWRRVIDFLRVHTAARNRVGTSQSSAGPSSPMPHRDLSGVAVSPTRSAAMLSGHSIDIENAVDLLYENDEEMSQAQAVMQACSLFVFIDDPVVTPASIRSTLRRRQTRAQRRAFGMCALREALMLPDVASDPFSMNELLLFLSASMGMGASSKRDAAARSGLKTHYLANLEGCSPHLMNTSQASFVALYGTLAECLNRYIEVWEDLYADLIRGTAATCGSGNRGPPDGSTVTTSGSINEKGRGKSTSKPGGLSLLGPSDVGGFGSGGLLEFPAIGTAAAHTVELYGQPQVALGAIKMLLSAWVVNYSHRDQRFIMASGVVEALYKLISLGAQEKRAQLSHHAASALIAQARAHPCAEKLYSWAPWKAIDVGKRLRAGELPCRAVLAHVMLVKKAQADPVVSRRLASFDHNFGELLKVHNVPRVASLYQLSANWVQQMEDSADFVESTRKELAKIRTTAREKLVVATHRLVGAFEAHDESQSQPFTGRLLQVDGSQSNRVVTLKPDGSCVPHCAYCTIEYTMADPSCQNMLGNYFEVKILKLGRKEIGIGLGNHKTFAPQGNMPGWRSGAYAYHGDDGKKFGEGDTPGIFPCFEPDDIIGCGLDFQRRAIFYTRNGELLGDAFLDVDVMDLRPIVGFVNRTVGVQSVSINFGSEPFVYGGTNGDIKINKYAVEHREALAAGTSLLQLKDGLEGDEDDKEDGNGSLKGIFAVAEAIVGPEDGEKVKDSSSTAASKLEARAEAMSKYPVLRMYEARAVDADADSKKKRLPVDDLVAELSGVLSKWRKEMRDPKFESMVRVERKAKRKEEQEVALAQNVEKVEPSVDDELHLCSRVDRYYLSTCYEYEARQVSGVAGNLLRLMLVLSCRNGDSSSSGGKIGGAGDGLRGDAAGDDTDADGSADLPALFPTAQLRRGLSSYGTSTQLTHADGVATQESIAAAIMQQVELGTMYLKEAPSEMGSGLSAPMGSSGGILGKAFGPTVTAAIPEDRVSPVGEDKCIAALQREQLGIDTMGGGSGSEANHANCDVFWAGEKKGHVPFDYSLPALEPLELESKLYGHIITLSSLMSASPALRTQLSKLKCARVLLSLFYTGSNRIRTAVCSMLQVILPEMSPEDAESILSPQMRAIVEQSGRKSRRSTANGAGGGSNGGSGRKQRRMPDSLIQLMMIHTAEVFKVPRISAEDVAVSADGDSSSVYTQLVSSLAATEALYEREKTCRSAHGNVEQTDSDSTTTQDKESIAGGGCYDSTAGAVALPHGVGMQSIRFAAQNLALLQALFKAPMWTELVACDVTDTIRCAMSTMDALEARGGGGWLDLSPVDENSMIQACAACSVLSGIGVMRPGIQVTVKDSSGNASAEATKGVLVSFDPATNESNVLFDTHHHAAESSDPNNSPCSLQSIEAVPCDRVDAVWECVDIDLSVLSQPLLPQMALLLGKVLRRVSVVAPLSVQADGESGSLLMRLCNVATTTVSAVLDKQPDLVIDAIYDAFAMGDIFSIATMPSGLGHFTNLGDLSSRWLEAQGRALELMQLPSKSKRDRSNSLIANPRSRSGSLVSIGSAADGELHEVDELTEGKDQPDSSISDNCKNDKNVEGGDEEDPDLMVSFLPEARAKRMHRAEVIAASVNKDFETSGYPKDSSVNAEHVLSLLEYYMMDEEKTRDHLTLTESRAQKAHKKYHNVRIRARGQDWYSIDSDDYEAVREQLDERDEGNFMLKHHWHDEDEGTSEEDASCWLNVHRKPSVELEQAGLVHGSYIMHVQDTSLVEGSHGQDLYGRIGTLVRDFSPGYLPVDTPANVPSVFVRFYDAVTGTSTVEALPLSQALRVKSFYGSPATLALPGGDAAGKDRDATGNGNGAKKPSHVALPGPMYALDKAMAILRIRYVAAKLVVESSFNLALGYKRTAQWLQLLKLVSSTAGSPSSPLQTMCSALLSRADTMHAAIPQEASAEGNNNNNGNDDAKAENATANVPPPAVGRLSIASSQPSDDEVEGEGEGEVEGDERETEWEDEDDDGSPAPKKPAADVTATDTSAMGGDHEVAKDFVAAAPSSAKEDDDKEDDDDDENDAGAGLVETLVRDAKRALKRATNPGLLLSRRRSNGSPFVASVAGDGASDTCNAADNSVGDAGAGTSSTTIKADSSNAPAPVPVGVNSDEKKEVIVVRSAHPYDAPTTTCGKILIPASHTRGSIVRFHHRCSLASSGASLSFYASDEDYQKRLALRTYKGPLRFDSALGQPTEWSSLVLPDRSEYLYYQFTASQGADKKEAWATKTGGRKIKLPQFDSSGLTAGSTAGSGGGDAAAKAQEEEEEEDGGVFGLSNFFQQHSAPDGCVSGEGSAATIEEPLFTSSYCEVTVDSSESELTAPRNCATDNNNSRSSTSDPSPIPPPHAYMAAAAEEVTDKSDRSIFSYIKFDSTGAISLYEGVRNVSKSKDKDKDKDKDKEEVSKPTSEVLLPAAEERSWRSGDRIGCLITTFMHNPVVTTKSGPEGGVRPDEPSVKQLACYSAQFFINGKPVAKTEKVRLIRSTRGGPPNEEPSIIRDDPHISGVLPVIGVDSSFTELHPNFGEESFAASAETVQGCYEAACAVGEKEGEDIYAVGSWTSVVDRTLHISESLKSAWGYEFRVEPLNNLCTQVTRTFSLVSKVVPPASSEPGQPKQSNLWVWRPLHPGHSIGYDVVPTVTFVSVGDVITLSSRPPRGAVIVDASMCVPPVDYYEVAYLKAEKCTIWRPVPPAPKTKDGTEYAAVGDVMEAGTSKPSLEGVVTCVPRWAVRPDACGQRLYVSGRNEKQKCSIWSVQNSLATFFASPVERRARTEAEITKAIGKNAETKVHGVGQPYSLVVHPRVHAVLGGEWTNESDALTMPSVSWVKRLLDFLLEHPDTTRHVVSKSMFRALLTHVQSLRVPAPLSVLPCLIRMIHVAQGLEIDLPLEEVDPLCKAVLARAVTLSSGGGSLPQSLCAMVDLVVAAQSAYVTKNNKKEFRVWLRSPATRAWMKNRKKRRKYEKLLAQAKAQGLPPPPPDYDLDILSSSSSSLATNQPSVLMRTLPLLPNSKTSRSLLQIEDLVPWYTRLGHVEQSRATELDAECLVKPEKLRGLFHAKDTVVRRLRQVLAFFSSLGLDGSAEELKSPKQLELERHGLSFPYPCPKPMIAKVWYNYASLCTHLESPHPYLVPETELMKNETAEKAGELEGLRIVQFPGSEFITILLDPRTSLGPGASLIFTARSGSKKTVEITADTIPDEAAVQKLNARTGKSTIDMTVASDASNSLLFAGDGVEVVFRLCNKRPDKVKANKEEGDEEEEEDEEEAEHDKRYCENDDAHWGWAFTAQGTHHTYDSAATSLLVDIKGEEGVELGTGDTALRSRQCSYSPDEYLRPNLRELYSHRINTLPKFARDFLTTPAAAAATAADGSVATVIPTTNVDDILAPYQTSSSGPVGTVVRHGTLRLPFADLSKGKGSVELVIERPALKKSKDKDCNPEAIFARVVVKWTKESEEVGEEGKIVQHRHTHLFRPQDKEDSYVIPIPTAEVSYEVITYRDETYDPDRDEEKEEKDGEKKEEGGEEKKVSEEKAEEKAEEKEEPAATEAVDPPDHWSCPACTFFNPALRTSCELCGTQSPSTSPRAAAGGTEGAVSATASGGGDDGTSELPRPGREEEAGLAGWWCAACTFINPLSATSCSVCSTPREDAAAPVSGEGGRGDEDEGDEASDDDFRSSDEDEAFLREQVLERLTREHIVGTDSAAAAAGSGNSGSPRLRCAGANSSETRDVVRIVLRAVYPSKEHKYRCRLAAALCATDRDRELSEEEEAMRKADAARKMSAGQGPSLLPADYMTQCTVPTPKELAAALAEWTSDMDRTLLEHINSVAGASSDKSLFTDPKQVHELLLPRKALEYGAGGQLQGRSMYEIHCRLLLLEAFNRSLEDLLPIVNLRNANPHSIGAVLRSCSRYVFLSLKLPILQKEIESTVARTGPGLPASILLDNNSAMLSRDNEEFEPTNSNCCFVQAFRSLHNSDPVLFRHIFADDRVMQINFVGESGIDAGGVFREGVAVMAADLFSDHFNLFILCPNGQHETYHNCDKFVPNPKHTSPLALEMFEFTGKLMAMSLRAKLMMPFEVTSMVWKALCDEPVTIDDLRDIDAISVQLITAVRSCEEEGVCDADTFSMKYGDKLKWTYNGSDGVERELVPGGASKLVTYDNKNAFCDAMLLARLAEFDKQTAAIKRGMVDIIPMRLLKLFSWQQVEVLVSGDPKIDIELWKSRTDCNVSARCAQLFWKVMESLTNKEQSAFIRFAWGRSRLPPAKDFTVRMRLTPLSGTLPIAHTCFFSIEMPDYETEEDMRHGLLTVINFGVGGVLVS